MNKVGRKTYRSRIRKLIKTKSNLGGKEQGWFKREENIKNKSIKLLKDVNKLYDHR